MVPELERPRRGKRAGEELLGRVWDELAAGPDESDTGLGETAGVVANGGDELPSAQAVSDGVAGGQPHHEATARELGHLQIV